MNIPAVVKKWNRAKKMVAKQRAKGLFRRNKPLVKTIKSVVKAVGRRAMETKYCARNVTDAKGIGATASTPADFVPLTTLVTQGIDDHQRIGDSIRPIVCKAHFTFYFDTTTQNNADLLVNFWIVRSRSAKGPQQVSSLTGGNFLKLGQGLNVDPTNPSQPSQLTLVSKYPLNMDAYIPLYHKNFRMRKGIGSSAGINTGGEVAPTGTPASEDLHQITYSWNPAVWNFDNTVGAPWTNFPTNEVPLMLVWATNADGSGGSHNLVYGLRTEVYYKDA